MADTLYKSIVTFHDNQNILVASFTALKNLLTDDNDLQESFLQEKWEMTLKCLTTFNSNPEVTQAILSLLDVIAANDQLMDFLVAENTQSLVMEQCFNMKSSRGVATIGCSLLCRLCQSDFVKEFMTTENFLRKSLVPMMYEHRSNSDVQQDGLILLCLLLKYNFAQNDEQNSLDLGPLYDWCDLISIAMSKHLDNIDVQICGCRTVSALMEYKPEVCHWIGEDIVDGQSQLPIHTLCLGAILMFREESEVFVVACEAIYWLAADNDKLCTQLMERNCHIAIMDGLTIHMSKLSAVGAGCKAVRGLCIFHEAYKHVVIKDGIQALITKAMYKFPGNPEIQIEVISMLACLGDVDFVRYQCFVDGIHSKILTNLDLFKDNEILQEASLECLSVLSAAGSNVELMNVAGTVTHVIEVLRNYTDSIYIQRKGLILLQVLASEKIYKDRSLHSRLAEVISTAMNTHSSDLGVVKEACVAIQILSEGGGRWMSDSFIKEGCPEILFCLLQQHNSDPQVHDLASECLYVLGLEQVLRSKMLLSACKAGNLPAADCLLELGADVNFVQDGCTPLYIAVEKQNEDLVQLLLRQHITDIQSPLRLSLEQSSHQITGMLLGHINKDREGMIMSWAGQGLGTLQPAWFVMALSNPARIGSTESGKLILTKIKKSQQKHLSRSAVFTAKNNDTRLDNKKYFRYKSRRRHHSDGVVKKKNLSLNDPVPRQHSYEGYHSTLNHHKEEGIPIPFSVSPYQLSPVNSYSPVSSPPKHPGFLSQNPGVSSNNPRSPNQTHGFPSSNPRSPTQNHGFQSISYRSPTQNSIVSTHSLIFPTQTHGSPSNSPKSPTKNLGFPSHELGSPYQSPGSPPNTPGPFPSQRLQPKNIPIPPPTQRQRPQTLPGLTYITQSNAVSPTEDHPVFELGPTSPDDIKIPVFEASCNDLDEWKTTTLTGANVPFSPSDPRLRQTEIEASCVGSRHKGEWKRKKQNLSPSLSRFENLTQHRLSVPVLTFSGDLEFIGHKRRNSDGHVSRSRLSSVDSMSSDQESRVTSSDKNLLRPSLFDLSCNALTSLDSLVTVCPDLAISFSCVTKLFIHDNKITSLPDEMFQYLPKLEGLDVRSNCLTVFPSQALKCPLLSVLDLSHNKIQAVSGLEQNTALKELYISHNNLRQISSTLTAHLQGLEVLLLSSNNIHELPETPLRMAMLQTLNLNDNHISFIPEQFLTGCSRLETLELSNNGLERLPSENMVTELPRLAKLKLAKNQLLEKEPFYIPKLILELPSLRSVDLSSNGLVGIPAPLHWKSTMLKEVLLCRNNITKLNLDGAKVWSKLEALNVSNNNISELPKEIGQLTSLTSLDISYNKSLTSLPDELGRCSKMWEMPLKGIGFSLDRIHRGKVKDLIAFLHNKLKKATRYYRMKLMVVGYGGRGKSTLLRALMKQYRSPQHDTPTVGVIVQDWKFERQKSFEDFHGSVTYTINTWDFAGQEDFYSTHQCYLTDRAVYLVVMDLRKGIEELNLLRSWLANIHARAPGCPVIVVGTFADLVPATKRHLLQNQIRTKLRDLVFKLGFADIQDFVTVNCTKETPEMEQFREFIKEKIDSYRVKGQPVMGQKVPADYVKLAEVLEEEVRNEQTRYPVITHTQLLKVIEKHRLDLEEEELKQAVRFLHRSGVLLHYEDAALTLKDLYFIDPGWLCRMMAQVVTVKQINPFIKNGILRKQDMKHLFTGKRFEVERTFIFPTDLLPQYIRLLEKFEIALQFSEEEVLIPCHLPDKRPDLLIPHLKMNEKITRHYIMPLVPLGLWSRLITRLVAFSNSSLTLTLVEEKRPPIMKYWKKGVFGHWSSSSFFLLDYHFIEDEEIHLMVPNTSKGSTLFGLLVDHISALVEEWYPGLTSLDPVQGRELLVQLVPCTGCADEEDQKHFLLDDLLDQTKHGMEIYCDVHKGNVPLSELAPDIMLNDLKPELQVDQSKFEFDESPDNLLGDGGYGAVYRGTYKGQAAAVKVFNVVGAVHPHKMQRQEATVLRCLNHPSIVSLLGVSFQPRVIVLELAPKGSLGNVLKSGRPLDRIMQHRIALQVAEGLVYLHQLMVVYRDMKPDNVLIYSLDLNCSINAKVSDYGIARFATLDGLLAQEGTPAYRAPEVIRGEPYSFTADVFSYGITLYALLTSGRHPFDEFEFKSEMDRAIAEGVTMSAITQRGASPWPDMESLLNECLYNSPDKRLQSKDIVKRLKNPDVLSLRSFALVSKSASLECFTVQESDQQTPVLWFTSGSMEHVELSRINLVDPSLKHQGTYFPHGRILCLQPITRGFLLVGSQQSRIWVYDTHSCKFRHSSSLLPDHVLCIKHIRGSTDDLVFAGLANGLLAVFPVSEIIAEKNAVPMCLRIGEIQEPVRCMEVQSHKWLLYASCGSRIAVICTRRGISMELIFDTLNQSKKPSPPVYTMALGTSLLLSHKGQPNVQMWEMGRTRGSSTSPKLRHTFNIASMFDLPEKQGRVTSLTLVQDNGMAWVGTGGGHIILIDLKSMAGVAITHRYSSAIRSLIYLRPKGDFKWSAVLSGGLGFMDKPGGQGVKDNEYSCLAVWDPNYDQTFRQFLKYLESRTEKETNADF
ncbi:leucine-rich repeat serine/threonine-protein kinase 2-like isoform X1 [Pecten maximus]|uniref:leucine-rich repeat serine/threonine-protein kinase 2-like isoform X1 n=1 Tax=Pecten maximus TaxID=6579 RepID=UPI001458DA8F|nr:leucine-rich repeat serine/threonine-protein kinase 2-like isoform X1 [Pecten maximus]XP_033759238.1 leucine-rich repeat serine/threonine-protein kinase 2-like isoform X1 [Pecten maximus]